MRFTFISTFPRLTFPRILIPVARSPLLISPSVSCLPPSRARGKNTPDELPGDLTTLEAVSIELLECLEANLEQLTKIESIEQIRQKKLQMLHDFDEVCTILTAMDKEARNDVKTTTGDLEVLEMNLQKMENHVRQMKGKLWSLHQTTLKDLQGDNDVVEALRFENVQCLENEEVAELDFLLNEFLEMMRNNEDGAVFLMMLLKRIQSIKEKKKEEEKMELEKLEKGPLFNLVNQYCEMFISQSNEIDEGKELLPEESSPAVKDQPKSEISLPAESKQRSQVMPQKELTQKSANDLTAEEIEESKVEAKDNVKEESKHEPKDNVKEESKHESKDNVKEESKHESKDNVKEESKPESKEKASRVRVIRGRETTPRKEIPSPVASSGVENQKTSDVGELPRPAVGNGGGGSGGIGSSDGGDDSGDDNQDSTSFLWLLLPCFLIGCFAYWVANNQDSTPGEGKIRERYEKFIDRYFPWARLESGSSQPGGYPRPAHLSSSLTRSSTSPRAKISNAYIETGTLFIIGVVLSKHFTK